MQQNNYISINSKSKLVFSRDSAGLNKMYI